VGLLLAAGCSPDHEPDVAPRTVAARGDLAADERATIELFRAASPSVVNITSIARRRDYFSLNIFEIPQGSGSGFIWDDQGHVITNFHVIQGASRATVRLADESEWEAQPVGVAPDQDIAVLRILAPQEQLPAIAVGTSADLLVGQKVFAIGNPFGLDYTLTTGIISALDREIQVLTGRTITGVIQTDAAINPGNSGGPLLDSAGRLIGMNTSIYSPSGASAGVGFAVPVDTIRRLVTQLIARGSVPRAGLGVRIAGDRAARRLGVERGALVMEVDEGSAAAKAGLRGTATTGGRSGVELGDIIVGVGSSQVNGTDDLANVLDEFAPGDTVAIEVNRGGRPLKLRAILQEIVER
jgi:S1-C subfamily serine protease